MLIASKFDNFTLVVEFEQAETLLIAEDEANCGHPHLF